MADIHHILNECIPYAKRLAGASGYKYNMDKDDLFQDMMLEIVKTYKEGCNNEISYYHAIIRNTRRSSITNHFRRFRTATRPGKEDISDMEIEQEQGRTDPMLMVAVRDELEKVNINTRTSVFGSYFLGMDHADIIKLSGVTERTSRTLSERFIKRMRDRLGVEAKSPRGIKNENEYCFVNARNGREVRATISDMAKQEGLDSSNLGKLVKGNTPSVKGWRIK